MKQDRICQKVSQLKLSQPITESLSLQKILNQISESQEMEDGFYPFMFEGFWVVLSGFEPKLCVCLKNNSTNTEERLM